MTGYDLARMFFYHGMYVGMNENLGCSVDLYYAAEDLSPAAEWPLRRGRDGHPPVPL
jgi:hypothetical protein